MWCKNCNVAMSISGTHYEQKNNGKGGYKRYNECPKCRDRIYNNSPNFQEVLEKVSSRSRKI